MTHLKKLILAAAVASATTIAALSAAHAQTVTTNNQGRDCQTQRTCNFSRGGVFRGCISSYSCRRCRTVRANCTINGVRRICREMRCDWGG